MEKKKQNPQHKSLKKHRLKNPVSQSAKTQMKHIGLNRAHGW